MAPFAITVRDTGLQTLRKFKRVEDCDCHNIQTHANNVDILVSYPLIDPAAFVCIGTDICDYTITTIIVVKPVRKRLQSFGEVG